LNSFPDRGRVLGIAGVMGVIAVVLLAAWLVARAPADATGGISIGGSPPGPGGDAVSYALPEGRTASEIGNDLEGLGVIRSARQFRVLVGLMGLGGKLSAGDYQLPRNASTATIVNLLTVKKNVPTLRVTFPEGIRTEEMAVLAEKAGFGPAADFMAAVRTATLPPDLAADLPPGHDRQGYLFPDTYILPVGATSADLVRLMVETLDRRFSTELRIAVRTRGLTLHEALTLASIVEREAVLDEERALIAGVFYNRIAAGDTLGADPTVQFAVAVNPASVQVFGWWKKELTFQDLEINSPYNTRKLAGIPPGPITNPGLASIEAVARPTQTKMYYFVADARKGDGSHVFAETLEQHLANIRQVGQ